jgi:hypothetical protein
VFSHIREKYHKSKKNITHKRRNSSHREKNSAATDKENHLLQKIILLSLHPLQQKIRSMGVDNIIFQFIDAKAILVTAMKGSEQMKFLVHQISESGVRVGVVTQLQFYNSGYNSSCSNILSRPDLYAYTVRSKVNFTHLFDALL